MPLLLTVTNTGRTPVTLELTGPTPTADFQVRDANGRTVWSRLRGEVLFASLRLFPLEAGKELSFREVWNQLTDEGASAPAGVYTVIGILLANEGLPSPPAPLSIEA